MSDQARGCMRLLDNAFEQCLLQYMMELRIHHRSQRTWTAKLTETDKAVSEDA